MTKMEAWASVESYTAPLASRVLSLLSENVLLILGLMLAGIAVGIGFMSLVRRLFWPKPRSTHTRAWYLWHDWMPRIATVAGLIWTYAAITFFVPGEGGPLFVMAAGPAVIAGPLTPTFYNGLRSKWLAEVGERIRDALVAFLIRQLGKVWDRSKEPPDEPRDGDRTKF